MDVFCTTKSSFPIQEASRIIVEGLPFLAMTYHPRLGTKLRKIMQDTDDIISVSLPNAL